MTPLKFNLRPGHTPQAPILYLVHGRCGNISVMSTFARSIPDHWALVFIEAPIADANGGFSWWDINDQENREQQKESSRELLANFIGNFATGQGLAPQGAIAFGFSQGAAILSSIVQDTPDILSGAAFLSGFILVRDIGSHRSLPKIFVAHGSEDTVVPLARIEPGIEHLRSQGYAVELVTEAVAHKVGISGMRALKEWVLKHFSSELFPG